MISTRAWSQSIWDPLNGLQVQASWIVGFGLVDYRSFICWIPTEYRCGNKAVCCCIVWTIRIWIMIAWITESLYCLWFDYWVLGLCWWTFCGNRWLKWTLWLVDLTDDNIEVVVAVAVSTSSSIKNIELIVSDVLWTQEVIVSSLETIIDRVLAVAMKLLDLRCWFWLCQRLCISNCENKTTVSWFKKRLSAMNNQAIPSQ